MTLCVDLHLPDDDLEDAALIEAAKKFFPNDPLGVYRLNYLRILAEVDDRCDRGDDSWT